ncbi:MAG: hypothetical protein IAF58_20990 [Leptolyngbya sp.]|nr:hypothetical protein [Candidatus Melainabacteria bacterium]
MKTFRIALVALSLALFGALSATPASAQGVGIYVGPGGVDVNIGRHRDIYYGNGGYRNDGYRWNDRYRGNGGYRNDYRQPIYVTVYEWRQVQTRYGWREREVAVRVVAYWSQRDRAYIYRDSYGRQRIYRGGY